MKDLWSPHHKLLQHKHGLVVWIVPNCKKAYVFILTPLASLQRKLLLSGYRSVTLSCSFYTMILAHDSVRHRDGEPSSPFFRSDLSLPLPLKLLAMSPFTLPGIHPIWLILRKESCLSLISFWLKSSPHRRRGIQLMDFSPLPKLTNRATSSSLLLLMMSQDHTLHKSMIGHLLW